MNKGLITGCPRSGTSLLTSMFYEAGVYVGSELLKETISNPRGYFESKGINELNNEIIHKLMPATIAKRRRIKKLYCKFKNDPLLQVPSSYPFVSTPVKSSMNVGHRIDRQLTDFASRESYFYKDPRFSVTLPIWLNYLPQDILILCVYRHPDKTVFSYQKNITDIYKNSFSVDDGALYNAYARNYNRFIKWKKNGMNIRFIHYDQLCDQQYIARLSEDLNIRLPCNYDNALKRSEERSDTPPCGFKALQCYNTLNKIAYYK